MTEIAEGVGILRSPMKPKEQFNNCSTNNSQLQKIQHTIHNFTSHNIAGLRVRFVTFSRYSGSYGPISWHRSMLAQPLMFPEASDTWNLSKANYQVKALFIMMAISKATSKV